MDWEVIVFGIAIVSGFTGLIVQGIKKILKDLGKTFPKNILVSIVSAVFTILLSVGYAVIFNVPFSASYVVWTVVVMIFGWLGRTLAYPSDGTFHNSLTASAQTYYYQNIPADADYITVYLGINDGNHYAGWSPDGESTQGFIDLGTIDDNTTASYYGAWNVVLSWLIQNRPFAHIGILVSNGCLNNDWREAQINIAKKYGVPYIDLNGDRFTPVMIRSQNPDISSTVKDYVKAKQAVNPSTNTHPNDNAHIYESYFIEDFLRTI